METDHSQPTHEMKAEQRRRWREAGRTREGDTRTLRDLVDAFGLDAQTMFDTMLAQYERRMHLLVDRAYLDRLSRVDFTETARRQFEDKYGHDADDFTVAIVHGEPVYQLNLHNFPDLNHANTAQHTADDDAGHESV